MRTEDPVVPTGFDRTLTLKDGRVVHVRPLVRADAAELGEAIRNADPATLYRRFCGTPPRVTPRLLERLTDLDYQRRFALVARDTDGHGVAIARYGATTQPGVAEIAVAVDPAWRRVGLASALVHMLGEAALARGFDRFTALYFADNLPVSELLDDAGGRRVIAAGVAEAEVQLRRKDPLEPPAATTSPRSKA
ncbi:GNAT family N-acetyltransferase [Amycolatopsis mongoliensis]|uniref:GNAT family N-acetyltransferase n=1 Tax=Amycolatopsis mongoliensis TaxID=715475 RepID=A0A9Y2JQY5_9PSEU|nr:GNAT family N-acetyltransferase [Amycolatopsis sp. 4-36]WIY02031.1 GNAT family N-acetyltransferase [Amycolatopsis sp. 4-36]